MLTGPKPGKSWGKILSLGPKPDKSWGKELPAGPIINALASQNRRMEPAGPQFQTSQVLQI